MNKSPKKLLVTIPQMINFFWTYSLHKKRLFFPLLFLRIVVPFLSLLPAFYYKELVDTIANFTGSNSLDLLPQLTSIVLIIRVIQLFRIILFRIADFLNITLAVEVVQKMYQDAFDYIHHHAYQFFTNVFSGALVRQIGKLTNAYETLMDLLFFSIFPMLISSLFIIIVSSSYSIYFGIILLGWLVVFSLVQYRLYKRNYPYEIKVNAADSECSGNFADTLTNYFNIKIFASIQREAFHFAKKLDHRAQLSKTRNYRKTLIHAVSALSIFVCEIGILYLTIRLWGAGLLSIGVFVLLQTYMFKLFDEFATLGHVFRVLFRAFWGATEMIEVLKTPWGVQDRKDAKKLIIREGAIVFKKVSFAYDKKKLFDNLSFSIKSWKKIALVGQSWSWKSTLIKLLFRFYDLQKGKILIDDQEISEVTQASLRGAMSMIPQDPILFHRSLKENIAYGKPNASDEEIVAAAKMARCHEFISHLKEGYETLVGERGVKLSGGERQRVAIARAILENKQIIVMDEATSALDSESEFLIQEAMEELMKHKTVLIIAHRLSTIMKMDEIIVMDEGKVVEKGSHKELLAKESGIYKKLRDIQSGGFIGQ